MITGRTQAGAPVRLPRSAQASSCRSRLDQLVVHAGVAAVGLTDTAIQLRTDPVEQVLWDDFRNGLQVAAGLGRPRRGTVPDPRLRNRGTGNDGPVSTATASSFLNAAGLMGG
jgi:hypothetical protein